MTTVPPAAPLLSVQGAYKAYDGHVVLRGIDLDLAQHKVTALIGSSGSGKSTLLRCVNLLDSLDDGIIELDGEDITDRRVDADHVRRSIGIVFQAFNLFPHMSVLDNVTLAPRKVHRRERREAVDDARELLARFGLEHKIDAYPDRLSGGQQQRVAIVRALATRPKLLLLDEITSALDPELVTEVLDVVRALKDDGMTMLIATHEMAFARDVADEVCFLDGGQVLERGVPAEFFAGPQEPRTRQFLKRVVDSGRL